MPASNQAPPVADPPPARPPADDEVDVTLIRWTLGLTPSQRLDVLQGFVDSVLELRDAARRP